MAKKPKSLVRARRLRAGVPKTQTLPAFRLPSSGIGRPVKVPKPAKKKKSDG